MYSAKLAKPHAWFVTPSTGIVTTTLSRLPAPGTIWLPAGAYDVYWVQGDAASAPVLVARDVAVKAGAVSKVPVRSATVKLEIASAVPARGDGWWGLALAGDAAEHRVAFTCRHHSCESMASYVLEGVMAAVLADDSGGDGKWLRERVEFFVVPIVDLDGVEDGDQGKNRKPRDHNRDYAGESIYPQVKAIRETLPKWADGKLRVAIDLHCPAVRGTHNEWIYFVGGD